MRNHMRQTTSETVEEQIIQKYRKLHRVLQELVDDLQVLEPGGTLMDDIVIPITMSPNNFIPKGTIPSDVFC